MVVDILGTICLTKAFDINSWVCFNSIAIALEQIQTLEIFPANEAFYDTFTLIYDNLCNIPSFCH